jgi:hypothetical protein
MIHIKDRLSDYHDFLKKLADDHQMVLASDVLEMIEQIKDDLEQDEKENGWIPVSERLPEDGTNVIASFSSGTVTELRYVANGIFHGIYEYSTKVIVAWRPLPEPYKED